MLLVTCRCPHGRLRLLSPLGKIDRILQDRKAAQLLPQFYASMHLQYHVRPTFVMPYQCRRRSKRAGADAEAPFTRLGAWQQLPNSGLPSPLAVGQRVLLRLLPRDQREPPQQGLRGQVVGRDGSQPGPSCTRKGREQSGWRWRRRAKEEEQAVAKADA